MITHPLSVANANASLLLNRAIDNFQWGPPSGQNVGPNKAPSCKATGTIWFFHVILFTKNTGHKELGQTTGFANAYYGPRIILPNYPMVRVIWNARILQSIYNRHQLFLLHKPKDYDGLCQHSESLWASRPPAHNWLPEPHKPCDFRQLNQVVLQCLTYATQALQTLQGARWEFWLSLLSDVPSVQLWIFNIFEVHDVEQVFAANTEPHQKCDETSPIDTFPALLWLLPAGTTYSTYSTYSCIFQNPSSRKVVWTLMARRILGLTRFSAVLPWRLRLTHAKLEESTSCIPSCYGPTWHL